jgi:hypothetical protein
MCHSGRSVNFPSEWFINVASDSTLSTVRNAIRAGDRRQIDGSTLVALRTLAARLQRVHHSSGGEPSAAFSPHVVALLKRSGLIGHGVSAKLTRQQGVGEACL